MFKKMRRVGGMRMTEQKEKKNPRKESAFN